MTPLFSLAFLFVVTTVGCDRDGNPVPEGHIQSVVEIQNSEPGQLGLRPLSSDVIHGVTFYYPEEMNLSRNEHELDLTGTAFYPVHIDVVVASSNQLEENEQGSWIDPAHFQLENACVEVDCLLSLSQPSEPERYARSRDICESLVLPAPGSIPEILHVSTTGHSYLGECSDEDRYLGNQLIRAAIDDGLLDEITGCWQRALSAGTVNGNQRISMLWGVRPQNSPTFEVRFSSSESGSEWEQCVESITHSLIRSALPAHTRTSPACNLASFVVSYDLGQRVSCL
jgi:hypothetical protein